jgi:hypothetical protein
MSFVGHPFIQTPGMDRLAREGIFSKMRSIQHHSAVRHGPAFFDGHICPQT